MALSQKHEGKSIVPWFCSAEWHYVYQLLYGGNNDESTKRIALDILKIWKARTPLLSCGVEGTLIILEAVLIDRQVQNMESLRLLLSSAIMRFLNICAAYSRFQGTFYATAKKMNLPDWLINLRHDAAHSHNLPPLDLLDMALKFCLDWLYREYWHPYSFKTEDFVDTKDIEMDIEEFENNLEPFLYKYCYICLVLHPYWSYKTLDDIQDAQSKRALIKELNEISGDVLIDENTSIDKTLKVVWKEVESTVRKCENPFKFNCFVDLLLKDDVFLGNFEVCNEVFDETFPSQLPHKFTVLWSKMLRNMHKLGMMETLITRLLKFLTKPTESHKKKWYAALWLSELGKSLSKCVLAKELRKNLSANEIKGLANIQIKKLLKEKCEEHSPELKHVLDLDYMSPVPELFKNAQKLKAEILDKPNEYTYLFIPHILKVNKRFQSENTIEQITELVKTYTTSEDDAFYFSKVYTVEDLNDGMAIDEEQEEDCVISEKNDEVPTVNGNVESIFPESIWKKATNINFEKYAIGILPSQTSTMNPLIARHDK